MLKPRRANMLEIARERARLVLDEDGERVPHARPPTPLRPGTRRGRGAAPAGIIGKHCSLRVDARVDDGRAAAGERLLERALELVLAARR